jgi:RimJ/RimL family protein N-acetyltransferase
MSDKDNLYEYAKSELVGPRAGWAPHKCEEDSERAIRKFIKVQDTYAVELISEHKVIGSVGLYNKKPFPVIFGDRDRSIGYVLNPNYWGQGYITEAVRAVLDYGFNNLGISRVWCEIYLDNENSKRVAEKFGFQYRYSRKESINIIDHSEIITLVYCLEDKANV